ncbi:MAG: aminopeptidase P family N-terminal domain-containing protein [Microthrixaceae bacterium]
MSAPSRDPVASPTSPFPARVARVIDAMAERDVDALCLSVGADLPWLTGYEAMPLERLTMAVLDRDGAMTLVVPELEALRVVERDHFRIVPWGETSDPFDAVLDALGGHRAVSRIAVGDRTWSRFTRAGRAGTRCDDGERLAGHSAVAGPEGPSRDRHVDPRPERSTRSPSNSSWARSNWWAVPRPRCPPIWRVGSWLGATPV